MPGYLATTEVYYCKGNASPTSSDRIAPAPNVTISPEIYYSNDNPIGYTYTVTLNGYANALRKEVNVGSVDYGLEPTVEHMGDIREIFSFNGGDLYIKQDGTTIIKAKGATIKNIEFNVSNNHWVNYAPFVIEIEFNEVDFIGCDNNAMISCSSSIFHQGASQIIISDNLIDITDHKIKEFSDKWSFTIDNRIYDNYNTTYNNIFEVSYTISATGKNYYVNNNLVPAWQQAKLFVQKRLHDQVLSLVNGCLQIETNNDSACDATKDLATIHDVDSSGGLLAGFKDGNTNGVGIYYNVYNEQITCNASESEGSFSLTYTAIVKKNNLALSPVANAATHTYTKDINITNDTKTNTTITIKGTVQGLIRGGFLQFKGNNFILPDSGSFITAADGGETKYSNALSYFTTSIGSTSDLLGSFKTQVSLSKAELLIKGASGFPLPSSYVIEHNYNEGSITYTAIYETSNTRARELGYTNISIVRNDPVDIIQEFVVPGRLNGPIIQKLNMKTARTISITIDGRSKDNKSCVPPSICDALPVFNIPQFDALLAESASYIKTREDYTSNKIDGSFSISLEYTAKG
jgi:hypothetical protein